MPLLKTGLLKEYLRATSSVTFITGGRKCQWNAEAKTVKFSNGPYIFSFILGTVFGLPEVYHTIQLISTRRKNSEDALLHKELISVGILMGIGNMVAYMLTIAFLHCQNDLEVFLNQVLEMEKRYWKTYQGNKIYSI